MKKTIYTLVAVTVIGLIAYGMRPQPTMVDLGTVAVGPMRVTVDEEGKTRIKERYTVVAPLAGQMKRIELKPGDPVERGHTQITSIEPTDPTLLDARAVASAKARVNSAKAGKEQATQMHQKAIVNLEYAETEHKRTKASHDKGGASDQSLKEAETLLRTRQLDLKAATFAEQIASFELEQAEAALLQVSPGNTPASDMPRMAVPSPINGAVLNVRRESAGVVQAGAELVELGDPRDLEVVVQVLSRDAVAIRPGAVTIFEQWGGAQPLLGRVRRIEPAGFTKISALGVEEQRVNVLIDFTSAFEERPTLGDSFRVEARIIVWQHGGVLKVPVGALFRQNGEWAAFVNNNGVARLRKLQIGHMNAIDAEVLQGLSAGDQVIMHPGDKITDGAKIIARD